jgi:thioredoxin reductase (NADPH)
VSFEQFQIRNGASGSKSADMPFFKTVQMMLGALLLTVANSFAVGNSAAACMSTVIKRDVVVIGSGPSGCTAATYLGRAMLSPLLIAGYNTGGQLMLTGEVENFPGRVSVAGPQLMTEMLTQAETYGAEIWRTDCLKTDFEDSPFHLYLPNCTVEARVVVIATGANAKWLAAAGEDLFRGKGISTCATCDGFLYRNKSVIVVGGGDSAFEEAIYLSKIASSVTLIHRRKVYRASKVYTFPNSSTLRFHVSIILGFG